MPNNVEMGEQSTTNIDAINEQADVVLAALAGIGTIADDIRAAVALIDEKRDAAAAAIGEQKAMAVTRMQESRQTSLAAISEAKDDAVQNIKMARAAALADINATATSLTGGSAIDRLFLDPDRHGPS